jgi:hypothetical protein
MYSKNEGAKVDKKGHCTKRPLNDKGARLVRLYCFVFQVAVLENQRTKARLVS